MYPLEQHSIAQTVAETQIVQAPADRSSTPPPQQDASLLLVPLCFMTIWIGVIYVIADTWKLNRKDTKLSRELAQLPCKKCRFFNNNPYVKCAVNPHIAMTRAANDCSDYRSRKPDRV